MGAQLAKEEKIGRSIVAEAVGTGIVVFLGCGGYVSAQTAGGIGLERANVLSIATSFGLAYIIAIASTLHVSGGHVNPAVTLCLAVADLISPVRALVYWLSQLIGAITGGALLYGCMANNPGDGVTIIEGATGIYAGTETIPPPFNIGANELNEDYATAGNGFFCEFMGTFILCIVVMQTIGDASSRAGNNAALYIGLAAMAIHLVLLPITSCGINPARTFGAGVVNSFSEVNTWGTTWWIFYLGPFLGAICAGIVCKYVFQDALHNKKSNGAAATTKAQELVQPSQV